MNDLDLLLGSNGSGLGGLESLVARLRLATQPLRATGIGLANERKSSNSWCADLQVILGEEVREGVVAQIEADLAKLEQHPDDNETRDNVRRKRYG